MEYTEIGNSNKRGLLDQNSELLLDRSSLTGWGRPQGQGDMAQLAKEIVQSEMTSMTVMLQ